MPHLILVVEDHDDARELLTLMLETLGHQVIAASDGSEAVTLAERENPDLILMDIGLPIMDGIEATRIIKMHRAGKSSVPIVAVTAHTSRYTDEVLQAGASEVVGKPVDFNLLEPVLSRYLN